MKNIFVINGSASDNSSNQKLIDNFVEQTKDVFHVTVFNELKSLPHFDPSLSVEHTPQVIIDLRSRIEAADGIVICTPEYVFSIPSGLKNAIEWCIATTVFTDKPTGIITASAHGQKGHEELQLIMQTVMARLTPDTTLLIQGVKGKVDLAGHITDPQTRKDFTAWIGAYQSLVENNNR